MYSIVIKTRLNGALIALLRVLQINEDILASAVAAASAAGAACALS